MYCRKCGAKIVENASFCVSCGSKVDTVPVNEKKVVIKKEELKSLCDNKTIIQIVLGVVCFSLVLIFAISYFTRDYDYNTYEKNKRYSYSSCDIDNLFID